MATSDAPGGDTLDLTGAEAIVEVLKAAGVTDVFGLASGKLAPLFRALSATPELRYTGVRHEAAAAFMAASAYAGSGRLAVCLGETGPGGLNLMSGLGGAWANNQAVLAITSSNASPLMSPARGAFSSTDNEKVFAPVTKWNGSIRHAGRIPELLHKALRIALSGRPGPVHLDVPAEVLSTRWAFEPAELHAPADTYRPVDPPAPSAVGLAAAANLLGAARRPLLVAGGGVIRSGGSEAFRRLAKLLQAPVVTTQMGLGAVSTQDPLFIGQGGFVGGAAVVDAVRGCDVMLAVGCRFSSFMWVEGPPKWADAPDRKLIHIDIDPEMLGLNAPLAVALQADARTTLEALSAALAGQPAAADTAWLEGLLATRRRYRDDLAATIDAKDRPMHPAILAQHVASAIGPDDFVTFDGGHTSFWSNEFTAVLAPATRFHEPGMSHLGFGLPAAIALGRCFPDRRSFCITGDGAFGFTLQELDTARRYGVNVVTVVHNNEAWGVIRQGQKKAGFEFGTDLAGADYAAIARGFGCHGERIEAPEEIGPALERALASGLPAVIDARVAFRPHPMFPIFGASTVAR